MVRPREPRGNRRWVRLVVKPKHLEMFVLRGRTGLIEVHDLYRPYSPLARSLFRGQLHVHRQLPAADPATAAALDNALSRLGEVPTAAAAVTSSWLGRIVVRATTPSGEWFVKHGETDDEQLRNEGRALQAIPAAQRRHFAEISRFLDDDAGVTLVTRRVSVHRGRVPRMADALHAQDILATAGMTHGDLTPQNLILDDDLVMIDLERASSPHVPYVDLAEFVVYAIGRRQLWTVAEARRQLELCGAQLVGYARHYDQSRDWRASLAAALRGYPWDNETEAEVARALADLLVADMERAIPAGSRGIG